MKYKICFLHTIFIFYCMNAFANTSDTTSPIIAKGAKLQMVANNFAFTEGPAVDKNGYIYFTDQPNDKIWKYDMNGKLSVFLNKTGRSNGLYIDKQENIIACADEKNELWSITPSGKVTVLMKEYKGKKLNGPNDLWIDANGGIYFTDPYYQRDYWTRKQPEIEGQKVYYLKKDSRQPVVVAEDIVKPNGIVGSADGKFIFVADIDGGKIYKYSVGKDASLGNRQLFASQGADGITLDNKGNLYACGNGVTVYNSTGKKIAQIDVPAKWTANACIGGKDNNILFITASESVYTLELKVKGIEKR